MRPISSEPEALKLQFHKEKQQLNCCIYYMKQKNTIEYKE